MLPVAEIDPFVSATVAAILSGGGITAWRVARTAKSESESITARTLIEVNEELRKEIDRRDKIIGQLERRLDHMRGEMDAMQDTITQLRTAPIP